MRILLCIFSVILFGAPAYSQVQVFACEPEWKALVDTLGGDLVQSFSATNAFQDPHYLEARPSLIAKTRRADLVICTGAELEIGWLPLLLRQSSNAKIQQGELGLFLAAEQVDRIEIPQELDRQHGDVHASGNPHVHWDPYRLLMIAEALSERLAAIDAQNSAHYKKRFQSFKTKWQKSIQTWEAQASILKSKRIVMQHKTWSYLLNWLGIEVISDLEPKPGIPPNSAHLAKVLQKVRSKSASFILTASFQDVKGANWLASKSNLPVLQLPFTVGGSDQAQDLFSLYDTVIASLVEGIEKERQ